VDQALFGLPPVRLFFVPAKAGTQKSLAVRTLVLAVPVAALPNSASRPKSGTRVGRLPEDGVALASRADRGPEKNYWSLRYPLLALGERSELSASAVLADPGDTKYWIRPSTSWIQKLFFYPGRARITCTGRGAMHTFGYKLGLAGIERSEIAPQFGSLVGSLRSPKSSGYELRGSSPWFGFRALDPRSGF